MLDFQWSGVWSTVAPRADCPQCFRHTSLPFKTHSSIPFAVLISLAKSVQLLRELDNRALEITKNPTVPIHPYWGNLFASDIEVSTIGLSMGTNDFRRHHIFKWMSNLRHALQIVSIELSFDARVSTQKKCGKSDVRLSLEGLEDDTSTLRVNKIQSVMITTQDSGLDPCVCVQRFS